MIVHFLTQTVFRYNLAMAEMKIFLALFVRRVDFDLVNMSADHVTWKKASIIPKPQDGAVISVTNLVPSM